MKSMNGKNPEKDLKTSVLERLKENDLNPRPKAFFLVKEIIFWFFWFLSTGVGAIAVAITLFVIGYRQYALYEATHDNFLTFMVEVLPFLWFFLLFLMIILATYNIRHTKRGYRYSLLVVVGLSVGVSFVGGVLLQTSGIGFSADRWLGHYISLYNSQEKIELRLWQSPVAGRIIGQVYEMNNDNSEALFVDIYNTRWGLVTTELDDDDIKRLGTGQNVKVVGQVLGIKPPKIHVCGVFPWFYDDFHSREEMREQREIMKKRAQYYFRNEESSKLKDIDTYKTPCQEMMVFSRFNYGY
ncbi:MAG: hypothetical protein R3B60_03700 [Candidatus Paceibacterota bacterium]